jgi:uncharacterized membrane protein YeaQ/YmgE (transglycosylase-associated protein family)
MLGLLVLLLVAAVVSLVGEALVPRGTPGGSIWAIVAGTAGAAQAAVIVMLLVEVVGRVLMKVAPEKPGDEPVTLTRKVKKAPLKRMT